MSQLPIKQQQSQQQENKSNKNSQIQYFYSKIWPTIQLFGISLLGILLTVQTTKNLAITNVLSSCIIGLFFNETLPKNADILFSATFAGMSSLTVFYDNMWFAVFTGFIHTLLFIIAKPYFVGFGGKLGTLAMISCILGAFLPYIIYGNDYTYPIHNSDLYEAEEIEENYYLYPIFAGLGSFLTFISKKYTKINGNPIKASCIVGILSNFLIALIYKDYMGKLSPVMYVGSFVGMSGDKILGNSFIPFTIAGIISGFILQGFNGTFLVGGKYGFSAFLAVVIYFYSQKLYLKILKDKKNNNKNKQESEQNKYIDNDVNDSEKNLKDTNSNQTPATMPIRYKGQLTSSLFKMSDLNLETNNKNTHIPK